MREKIGLINAPLRLILSYIQTKMINSIYYMKILITKFMSSFHFTVKSLPQFK